MAKFPIVRPRRLRENPILRELVQETRLSPKDLVMPLFVRPGKKLKTPIASMPGMAQLSPDQAVRESETLLKQGVRAVLLFGITEEKDAVASAGSSETGPVQQAIALLKKELPELLLMADVCLCDYTDHGHCGLVVEREGSKVIDNDSSLEVLSRIAGSLARSGADVLAPSDMMDGRVSAIRDELDAAGFKHLPIMSYAVKYASAFYGPFREALESAPQFGDRRSYQMDPANLREALKEAEQDLEEGADILMVKPALPYLDVIKTLRDEFPVPLAAYQVSGEYTALKLAAQAGAFEEKAVVLETWLAMKRAGADIIISYFARDFAEIL
jgi:porphobilinogen synthase